MWMIGKEKQLERLLKELAEYNDKGVHRSKHDDEQAEAMRSACVAKIRELIGQFEADELPEPLVVGIDQGAVKTDASGHYYQMLKAHFQKH